MKNALTSYTVEQVKINVCLQNVQNLIEYGFSQTLQTCCEEMQKKTLNV